MGAPSLSCEGDFQESYRLLWIGFYRPALIVSITRVDGHWEAESVEFRHPKTELIWALARRQKVSVSNANVQPLLEALETTRFWTIPAWVDSGAHDGAVWILEGRRDRGYRVVSRANPRDFTFVDAAQRLVRLGGIAVPEGMVLLK
jgi:hypothetical protein